jgi:soluble lytic murein transglycosylase-like protein
VLRAAAGAADSFDDRFHAEVWLTDMSRRLERQVQNADERMRILTRVHYEASLAGLAPELVLAVIDVESNFDAYAVSVAGALGLMQVMPFWRNEIGRPNDNLIRLETNLRYGCTILKFYLDKEKGDLRRALGRYNGSLGKRDYPNRVVKRLSEKWYQI